MVTKYMKGKQQRLTLEDARHYQDKLKGLLKELIAENRPLKNDEKKLFFDALPKALLSQGVSVAVSVVIKEGWFIFSSVQNMAHRLADLNKQYVYMGTTRPEPIQVTIEIKELWQFLYDQCLYLFPLACGEALHISAETQERQQQGTYDFSSGSDLG